MIIKAIVAARSGSERVQNKNIRKFADTTLVENKIEQLQQLSILDGVILNSNDDHILELGNKKGCELVKRDEYYALSKTSMLDVFKNIAECCDADIIVYANCTNPLVDIQSFDNAIKFYLEYKEIYDSVNSAHLIKEYLFNNNQPVNFDLNVYPRSQDLPDYYALNFAINVISRENMIKYKHVVGRTPYLYPLDEIEAIDIDSPLDFKIAELLYINKRDSAYGNRS